MSAIRGWMADLSRWSEGEGELVERLRPGACEVAGRSVFADGFSIADAARGSYHVAAARQGGVDYLVTSRTWLSGYDEWEAAGRPSDPDRMPQHGGLWLSCVSEGDWKPAHRAFVSAVGGLHAALSGRCDDARREAAFAGVEQAMRAVETLDLARSGIPEWLLDAGADADEEPDAPAFGP